MTGRKIDIETGCWEKLCDKGKERRAKAISGYCVYIHNALKRMVFQGVAWPVPLGAVLHEG